MARDRTRSDLSASGGQRQNQERPQRLGGQRQNQERLWWPKTEPEVTSAPLVASDRTRSDLSASGDHHQNAGDPGASRRQQIISSGH